MSETEENVKNFERQQAAKNEALGIITSIMGVINNKIGPTLLIIKHKDGVEIFGDKKLMFDVLTNFNLGKVVPQKSSITTQIPLFEDCEYIIYNPELDGDEHCVLLTYVFQTLGLLEKGTLGEYVIVMGKKAIELHEKLIAESIEINKEDPKSIVNNEEEK